MVMADYSYRVVYFPRGTSRDAARRTLTQHAEYGHWELSQLRLYPDGSRRATLRRMIIRQVRGQAAEAPADYAGAGPPPGGWVTGWNPRGWSGPGHMAG